MQAILVERDYKGIYERFALTPEEFRDMFPEVEVPAHNETDTATLAPLIHIWFCACKVGDDLWNTFFTDMEWGLPFADIFGGNLASIRTDFMKSLVDFLPTI